MLAPFPAAYIRLLHGRLASLIVMFGSATAIAALSGSGAIAGFLYLGMCLIMGLIMPELLLQGLSASRTLFWTTIANILLITAGFVAYNSFTGIDLQQFFHTEISGSLNQAVAIYEKSGVKGEELEFIKHSMATVADLLLRLYPALITAMLIVVAGCNLLLIKKTFGKTVVNLAIGDFSSFRNPDMLVWVLIATGFTLLLPVSVITNPALNVLLIISLLYFFQGMAVVSALITKYSVSVFLRVVLYAILIIQPYLLALVVGIGLFDLWVDFRTPKTQENL